ncbi:CBO0543 family protein [Bacillus alkalicellulosilyticus]|uniref:CBO0543 family protein n=1 Tax=Alkalihalobacterium alkalicellulosilyticum TaxID=1912214 RepID=UPI001FED135C|nr:CBO0543 family protein [Bacillus alkalicellulosilyticus]
MIHMHLATALFVIFAVWKWGDWRNWQKYHTTILFYSLGNLAYNFLTANYFLWRFNAEILVNHTIAEMVYTFVVFPGTIILFLGNYPTERPRIILHHFKWITIYGVWEWVFTLFGKIEYQYGWTLGWSVAFLVIMFPLLALHHRRPLLVYFLSAIVAVLVLWYFEVPVHIPIEYRNPDIP